MARYTGPKSKIARKFGEAIYGADKVLSKKNYPPGQHGVNRKRKVSEYGMQLKEKQKANILTVYLKGSSAICSNAHNVPKALPARCFYNCWNPVLTMWYTGSVSLLPGMQPASW